MSPFEHRYPPVSELIVSENLGVMKCLTADRKVWVVLGGAGIASAVGPKPDISPESLHYVHLQFHGGRQQWMVEVEKVSPLRIYPREDHWGSLPQMMKIFASKTGLVLPAVRLVQAGLGVSTVTQEGESWDKDNPFELLVGGRYSVLHRGRGREIEVSQRMGKVEIAFVDRDGVSETFDPRMILGGEAWLSLRRLSPGDPAPVFPREDAIDAAAMPRPAFR